jgi:hypothetical protein
MALEHGRLFLKTDNFIIDSTQIAMVFLYNADNSAPFFDSILFRDEVFWTFSVSHTLPFNACGTHLCSLSLEIARERQLCYLS